MRKLITAWFMLAAVAFVCSKVSLALVPSWDITGSYVIEFKLDPDTVTVYPHDAFLTQTGSTISGNGGYLAGVLPYTYEWLIDTGSVTGNSIAMTMHYTVGAVGTTMQMAGTISPDGTISGTWIDDLNGGARTGTWATVSGNASISFPWGSEVNASNCEGKIGKPVINVTEKIVNDVDSGLGGYWAFDNYNREIQVWKTGEGRYCAVVRYEGKYDAQEGKQSPGNTEELDGDEDGTFQGGRTAIITGTLLSPPLWSTKGSVGTVDYSCEIDGSCDPSTYVSWVTKYFAVGHTYNDEWWGWIYHGGEHGTWINSLEGNFGDIY